MRPVLPTEGTTRSRPTIAPVHAEEEFHRQHLINIWLLLSMETNYFLLILSFFSHKIMYHHEQEGREWSTREGDFLECRADRAVDRLCSHGHIVRHTRLRREEALPLCGRWGKPTPFCFSHRLGERIGVLHKKRHFSSDHPAIPRDRIPGMMHLLIFWGFLLLAIGTAPRRLSGRLFQAPLRHYLTCTVISI